MEENTIEAMSIYDKIAAMRDESVFVKDSEVKNKKGGKKYDIWTEASVMGVVIPAFQKYHLIHFRENIIVHFTSANIIKITAVMKLVNLDKPEEFILFTGLGTGSDMDDKDSGKASTYAVKDAMLKLFMANTGLDPDLHGSEETLGALQKNAKVLLDDLWKFGYFSGKAGEALGQEAADEAITTEATRLYQKRAAELADANIQKLRDTVQVMTTLANKYR